MPTPPNPDSVARPLIHTQDPVLTGGCDCRWCQRETGTSFVLNAMIESDRVELQAAAPVLVETPSASGKGQQVARCPKCHVAVRSHYGGAGRLLSFVRVGSLDEPDQLPPDLHIFTDTKQPWLALGNSVPVVDQYYEIDAHWPPESLARWQVLLPLIKAQRDRRCGD